MILFRSRKKSAGGLSHVCRQTAQFRYAEHAPGKDFNDERGKISQKDVRQASCQHTLIKKKQTA